MKTVATTTGQNPSGQIPLLHNTNSNNPGKVSSYPARHIQPDAPQFLFSTRREIHLYECGAYPDGMGVVE